MTTSALIRSHETHCAMCMSWLPCDEMHSEPEFGWAPVCSQCCVLYKYRTPKGSTVPELVKPGNLVKTNYGTGPYVVRRIEAWDQYFGTQVLTTYSLVLSSLPKPRRQDPHYPRVNKLIGINGRIRSALVMFDDEVFVLNRKEIAQVAQVQLFPLAGEP
jgi:hypothetical protein